MVAMPSTLTVRGRDRQDDGVGFDVVNEAGAPVLSAGRIRFRSASWSVVVDTAGGVR
jgi:hypothetical protein